eukprot:CAMPEP_0178948532 /NCGR_PEP_ID=MMETSP0789-20121207/5531_1 /TAXON_ID=3005 /ORGANISM="Rhizosolenia setigera, Strain CCMP 1694" /LENGTH=352 /DNA_ID=CAMNT_0020628921 /DNA_START=748 /DNA_END=1806 /DNA_ORIENTATION=+
MVYDMTWPYEAVAFSESFSVGGTKISTSKSCYSGEEMVRLSFSNPVGSRVWIAIFPEDTDPSNISGSSQNWAWPCGSQGCRGDSLTSNEFDISVDADGMWRAFLMNDMYAPYKSLAYSNSFEVKSTSGNCPNYFISVSKGAYLPNEPVVINFENPLGTRIWFGVYEASADPTNLNYSQSEDYVYPCGDKTCTDQSLTSGTVTLNNVEAEGNWRVYLISFSDTWPYQALAFTKDEIMVRSTVSIATSKSSYSVGEVVNVNYVNASNERFWMGVYESSADPTNLNDSQSEDWAWPCGDKDCTEQSLSSGTVELFNVGEGSWRVYFMTDMTWPYESVMYSEEFTVDSLHKNNFCE